MSKNKKNKKNATEKVTDKGFVDEQILSQAIVKAYFEIEAEKEEKAKAKAEKERKKVLNDFGQKEYPDNENAFKKFIHKRGNDFRLVKKLLFIKKEEVKNTRATFALMSLTISLIFSLAQLMLYLLSVGLVLGVFLKKFNIFYLLGALISWLLARIFRIAIFEIDEMRDDALLTSIFSGVLAFVAAIAAILALLK